MVGRKESRAARKATAPPTPKTKRPPPNAKEGRKNPLLEQEVGPANEYDYREYLVR